MKNKPFFARLTFAYHGIAGTLKSEASFRTQALMAAGAVTILLGLRPEPIWWAVFGLTIGTVLAAEMMNTALELVIDRLHPHQDPMIGRAKDCAAGAVLILSVAALGVFAAIVYTTFR